MTFEYSVKERLCNALAMNEADRRKEIEKYFIWNLTSKGYNWWASYYRNDPDGPTDSEACAELRAMIDQIGGAD